jgi:hypothetical protein
VLWCSRLGFKEDFKQLAQQQELSQQTLDDFYACIEAQAQELLTSVEEQRIVCLKVSHEEELEELEVC